MCQRVRERAAGGAKEADICGLEGCIEASNADTKGLHLDCTQIDELNGKHYSLNFGPDERKVVGKALLECFCEQVGDVTMRNGELGVPVRAVQSVKMYFVTGKSRASTTEV